jgi:hypothetical protein
MLTSKMLPVQNYLAWFVNIKRLEQIQASEKCNMKKENLIEIEKSGNVARASYKPSTTQ